MPRMRLSPYSKDDQSEGYKARIRPKDLTTKQGSPTGSGCFERRESRRLSTRHWIERVFPKLRQFCVDSGNSVPFKGGASGRLSELSGLGLVKCETNEVELLDPETQHYRLRKPQGWFPDKQGRCRGEPRFAKPRCWGSPRGELKEALGKLRSEVDGWTKRWKQ